MTRPAVLAALLSAAPAAAHDYWLVPDTFTPKPGTAVPVRLYVGEAFKPEQEIAYQPKRTAKLELHAGKQLTADFPGLKDGAKPAFAFAAPKAGTAVLRVDRDWAGLTMKPDKFAAYLKEEGFDHVLKARAAAGEAGADGRERYRRYLKTVVQVGPDGDDTPTRPLGQRFEITPAKNPFALKAGDELPVTVTFDGKPLAGARVAAWHRDGDQLTAATATTAADGTAALKLTRSGPWVVRAVHMRRVAEKNPDPPADWESFWAAVTFAVP